MIPLDDPMSLSLLFHLNSEPWLNDRAYQGGGGPQKRMTRPDALAEVVLPPPSSTALSSMFRRRFSCRAFHPGPIALDRVALLLDAAYGLVGPLDVPDPEAFPHRTVPSAGGLFPLELFAILRRIDGLEDGLYHYNAAGRALSLHERGDLFPKLEPMFYTFPFIADANIVIALAAVFPRSQTKYGPRGYRYVLLEAGHVAQNICLRAAEIELATLCMGGFVDSALNAMLGLKSPYEGVVYTVAAGVPEPGGARSAAALDEDSLPAQP